jgi:colanic acid/amylovoran biosynthesis glycosyltransferase
MKKRMLLYKVGVVLCICLFHSISCAEKPLRILFIVGHFPSPSQIFILNIMTGLIDRGHDVSIFSFHKDSLVDMHPNIEKYGLLKRTMIKIFLQNYRSAMLFFVNLGI